MKHILALMLALAITPLSVALDLRGHSTPAGLAGELR